MGAATSAKDPRVLRAARLLRARDGTAFVVDGAELLEEALAAGVEVEWILAAEPGRWVERATGAEVAAASPDALRALGALGQAPEVVAVCRTPPEPAGPLPPRSLVLARVTDGGNVGSIVRTAAALGLPRVSLTSGCADPWSRRALRAAMGATFAHGLVATGRELEGPALAAAVPHGGIHPQELPSDASVVLGNEADGLSDAELARCELRVTIPATGFESLNVAAAAAILAWHLSEE